MTLEEILAKLKATYANKGLPEKVLEVFAKRLLDTATEENIDELVSALDGELSIQQSIHDQIRTLKKENEKLQNIISKAGADKTEPPKPEPDKKDPEPPKPSGGEEPPKWAQSIIQELQALKAEKAQKSTEEKLTSKFEELKVDKKFYSLFIAGQSFESDDDLNSFVEDKKKAYDELMAAKTKEGMQGGANPDFAQGEASKEKVSPLMKGFLNNNKKDNNESN